MVVWYMYRGYFHKSEHHARRCADHSEVAVNISQLRFLSKLGLQTAQKEPCAWCFTSFLCSCVVCLTSDVRHLIEAFTENLLNRQKLFTTSGAIPVPRIACLWVVIWGTVPVHLPWLLTRRPPDYSSNLCPPKTFAIWLLRRALGLLYKKNNRKEAQNTP